jgi:hypothetical protein
MGESNRRVMEMLRGIPAEGVLNGPRAHLSRLDENLIG